MKAGCIMVICFIASVVAVPVQPISNQTHRSSHNPPMSQAPPNLRPVVPSYNQSHNQTTQTFRHLTQVSSSKTATAKTTPTAPNKVEEYAKKLRADMQASERVLNVYIKTIKDRHSTTESKLKTVKSILKGLKDEIANATKYANQYQSQDTDLTKQDNLYKTEYDKSYKMYQDEAANIKFEKQFLDAILQYIKLRKTQKC
jgi:hypothetical protein